MPRRTTTTRTPAASDTPADDTIDPAPTTVPVAAVMDALPELLAAGAADPVPADDTPAPIDPADVVVATVDGRDITARYLSTLSADDRQAAVLAAIESDPSTMRAVLAASDVGATLAAQTRTRRSTRTPAGPDWPAIRAAAVDAIAAGHVAIALATAAIPDGVPDRDTVASDAADAAATLAASLAGTVVPLAGGVGTDGGRVATMAARLAGTMRIGRPVDGRSSRTRDVAPGGGARLLVNVPAGTVVTASNTVGDVTHTRTLRVSHGPDGSATLDVTRAAANGPDAGRVFTSVSAAARWAGVSIGLADTARNGWRDVLRVDGDTLAAAHDAAVAAASADADTVDAA